MVDFTLNTARQYVLASNPTAYIRTEGALFQVVDGEGNSLCWLEPSITTAWMAAANRIQLGRE